MAWLWEMTIVQQQGKALMMGWFVEQCQKMGQKAQLEEWAL